VFRIDVAKVDRDVAIAIHVYCKCMFQMFHLFLDVCLQVFHLNVAYILHISCKCFIWMLHRFYNGFSSVFMCFC
jgi:hypothetical protein